MIANGTKQRNGFFVESIQLSSIRSCIGLLLTLGPRTWVRVIANQLHRFVFILFPFLNSIRLAVFFYLLFMPYFRICCQVFWASHTHTRIGKRREREIRIYIVTASVRHQYTCAAVRRLMSFTIVQCTHIYDVSRLSRCCDHSAHNIHVLSHTQPYTLTQASLA